MTEVFISYAREDQETVRVVADALSADGFEVWWDRTLLPGDEFRHRIEEELTNARCVVVCWSEASSKSRWVFEEAEEALEQEKLTPILIGGRRPPLGFRTVQYEDFRDWSGDRRADAWQKLRLQVSALARGRIGGETETPPPAPETAPEPAAAGAPPAPPQTQSQAQSGPSPAAATIVDTRRRGRPVAALGMLAMFAGALGLLLTGGAGLVSGYWATVIGLAAFALTLFFFADREVADHRKALVARWLLPVAGGARVSSAAAFLSLFEAVFGARHFSRKCFLRSTLASVLVFSAVFFGISAYQGDVMGNMPSGIGDGLVAILLLMLIVNVFGDYVSLGETRFVLRAAADRGAIVAFVFLDILLSALVFVLSLMLGMYIYGELFEGGGEILESLNYTVVGMAREAALSGFTDLEDAQLFGFASLVSAATTSVWLWLALALTPIMRFATWSSTAGRTWIGALMGVQNAPITALGYGAAILVLMIGGVIWGVGVVLEDPGVLIPATAPSAG